MTYNHNKQTKLISALMISTAILATAPVVHADDDEVIVTARKSEESLYEVPIAITAFSEVELERQNIVALEDLAAMTPALSFQDVNGAYQNPSIRGLTQTAQISAQGNVGVFLDGVFLNNRSTLEFGNIDLARIEVVKGPQSALYGRNTFGGAINYVTRTPELGKFGGQVKAEVGDYGRWGFSGHLNIPLGDFGVIQPFGGISEFDGTIDNSAGRNDDRLGGYTDRDTFGGKIYLEPTNGVQVTLFGMNSVVRNDAPALQLSAPTDNNAGSPTVGGFGGTGDPLFTAIAGEFADIDAVANFSDFGLEAESTLFYGKLQADLGFADLTALISHGDTTSDLSVDITNDPDAVNTLFFGNFSRQSFLDASTPVGNAETYELRLQNDDGPLRWSIGTYYYDSIDSTELALAFQPFQDPTGDPLPFFSVVTPFSTEAISVFGSLGYDFSDKLSGTVELRYTSEDLDLLDQAQEESQNFNFVVPRFTLEYQTNDDILIYANVGRGLKTGGYNTNVPFGNAVRNFQEETNWSYEIGTKGEFFEGRVLATLAAWYVDWQDVQVSGNVPGTPIGTIFNSGSITSKGVELDALINVTDNFSVRLAGAILDPKYDDGFIDGEVSAACGAIAGTIIANPGCSDNVGGNQVSRTSDFQFSASANYVIPEIINDFDGYIRGDFSHEAGKFSTGLNLNSQGAINLTNLRAGISNDKYELSFYVDNVFDANWTRRITVVGNGTEGFPNSGVLGYRVYPGQRRTIGANLRVNF